MQVRTKRVYADASRQDGRRVLVDRMWPRGVRKEAAAVDEWLKEVAPSAELRKWFGHDPGRWDGFLERYRKELEQRRPEALERLRGLARQGRLTLVYAAKDEAHNNAVALKRFLEAAG